MTLLEKNRYCYKVVEELLAESCFLWSYTKNPATEFPMINQSLFKVIFFSFPFYSVLIWSWFLKKNIWEKIKSSSQNFEILHAFQKMVLQPKIFIEYFCPDFIAFLFDCWPEKISGLREYFSPKVSDLCKHFMIALVQ